MTHAVPDQRTGRLPAEVTSFIGRRDELAAIERALGESRLVTLCGPGGVGKSRLALRAAAALHGVFPDGVHLVELSGLRDPALLADAIADALRLPHPAGDPLDLLAEHLAGRRALLVLDTCEHLVDACALLVEVLVRASPGLAIIATSREPLDVIGETTVPVGPLAVPPPGGPVEGSDAVALFADRAAAICPAFAVDDAGREAVAQLCRRLDGIPLAIELAAARLRVMSVEQLLARLGDRFRLLGTARAAQPRHQTLRATVSWSHDLCTADERLLWARLSVFPGAFDLEAAEAVCADERLPAGAVLGVLSRLVDKSVVRYHPVRQRYRMLATLAEFGAELLDDGARAALVRRHRDHVIALAEEADAHRLARARPAWARVLRAAGADLRTALEWSLATPGEEEAGLRLAVLLREFWCAAGRFGEGRAWFRRALARTGDGAPGRGWALFGAGQFAIVQDDLDDAADLLAEALRTAEDAGDAVLRAHVVQAQGRVRYHRGDPEGAIELYRRAEDAYARDGGHRDPTALLVFCDLGAAHAMRGDLAEAAACCERGLAACDRTGEQWARAFVQWMRGGVRWLAGDAESARRDARAVLRLQHEQGDLPGTVMALDLLLVTAQALGDPARALVLAGTTRRLWTELRAPVRGPFYAALRTEAIAAAEAALGPDAARAARRRGAAFPLADAVAYALGEGVPAAADDDGAVLTRREREVALLVAEGLTNRAIAGRLVIAKRTADSHIEHILAKLGFTSRTQIAAWIASRPAPVRADSADGTGHAGRKLS
ncbi:ATP-binding protein [Actinomadura parmotrematis]|uniref:LuxR C-terminal-related transcriptional regulator n=1 Tax=Actinomadura parmotrematis TaxID=2864039 RepID=A0ABS7FYC3_9ACTN|nr:LuxR C-terminal-related transcriptional regulator [Actinomadura parmotrematis]MBW8485435.1 LuxR C-terminal-related transcriptional regulator [Actinomadura parmotrematis]